MSIIIIIIIIIAVVHPMTASRRSAPHPSHPFFSLTPSFFPPFPIAYVNIWNFEDTHVRRV